MHTADSHIVDNLRQTQDKTLSKQEQFAMAAMTSLVRTGHGFNTPQIIADNAVAYANALIKAIDEDKKA